MFFILSENTAMKKGKQLVNFDYQNVNSSRSLYLYISSLSLEGFSIECQKTKTKTKVITLANHKGHR